MALPNQPTAPTLTAISEGINVSWSAATGATSYDIQADNNSTYASINFSGSTEALSIVASPLINSTAYYVRIRSRNDEGTSNWVAAAATATPLASLSSATVPSTNINETDYSGHFQAGWDAPTGAVDGTTEYELAYTTSNSNPTPASVSHIYIVTTARTLRVPETGVITNGTWYWWVRTLSDDDTGPSAWSSGQTSTPSLGEGMDAPTVTLDDQSFQIFASWTEVANATGYDLQWGTSTYYAPASTTLIENIAPDARSQLFTELNNGTTYYFQVRTRGPDGIGNWSTSMSSRPDYADGMAAPTTTLVAESEQARLSWTAVESATAYDYVYSTSSSTPGNVISALNMSTYTAVEDVLPTDLGPGDNGSILITELNNGTTYRFWVRTKGPSGVGAWSTVATVTPSTANGAPLPTNLAVEIGSQLGRLTWDGDADDIDYDYAWGTNSSRTSSANFSNIDEDDLPGRMLLLPVPGTDQAPLRNDQVTYFWVRARSAKGYSAWTASVNATPSASNAPLTPIGLAEVAVGETEVELEFELSADATDYDYRYKITTDTEYTEVTTEVTEDPDIEEGSILVTGLLPNTSYHFSVRAKHDQGPSDWAADITITTLAVPSGLSGVGGDERVLLLWNTDDAATDYDYRSRYSGADWVETTDVAVASSPLLLDEGIANNQEYEFGLRAKNATSTTYWSPPIEVRPIKPQPDRPQGLMATGGPAEVLVEWTVLGPDLLYDIRYREADENAAWLHRHAIALNRVVVHNLTVGTTYEFQVRATNAGGGVSDWTDSTRGIPTDATLTDPEISEITVSPVEGSQEILLTLVNDLPTDVEIFVTVEVRVPGDEYPFAYELPEDFLKVLEVRQSRSVDAADENGDLEPVTTVEPEGNLSQTKPVVDGRLLYTDVLNPLLKYIGTGSEENARGSFRLIVSTLLASRLARKYQKNTARAQELLADYERHLPLALASVEDFVDYKALQFETVQDSDQGQNRQ